MFRINPEAEVSKSQRLTEVEFAELGLKERYDIQEWIAADPDILEAGLLIVAKEYSAFDKVRDRVDLLAVDRSGALVIIELKRDDSGEDVHWQAIKYASYLHRIQADDVVKMRADYGKQGSGEDATGQDARAELEEHLQEGNLDALNKPNTRIILASHRFAPHVTSAALWLNEQVDRNLITCVQLKPFRDEVADVLYLQTNVIIPVPGTERLRVNIGPAQDEAAHSGPSRQKEYDEIKAFFQRVEELAGQEVSSEVKPEKRVRHGRFQWTNMWYSRHPWGRYDVFYMVSLSSGATRMAQVSFGYDSNRFDQNDVDYLERLRETTVLYDDQERVVLFGDERYRGLAVKRGVSSLNDETAAIVAGVLRKFMEIITPKVDGHFKDRDRGEAPDG